MTYPFRYNDCLRSSKCVDILGQGDCMLLIYILIYIKSGPTFPSCFVGCVCVPLVKTTTLNGMESRSTMLCNFEMSVIS